MSNTNEEDIKHIYNALESSTRDRLSRFNTMIKEERKSSHSDKDKLTYLKTKRTEVTRSLNAISNLVKNKDYNAQKAKDLKESFMAFHTAF